MTSSRLLLLTFGLTALWLSLWGSPLPVMSQQAAQSQRPAEAVGGRLLFVKEGNLWTWSAGRARQFTSGDSWRQPQWSPDGSEIAYVYRGSNFSDIFVMNADGSNNRRLTRSQSSS